MDGASIAAGIAAALEVRDDVARTELKGTEIFAYTQGGTLFRVLVIWPGGADVEASEPGAVG